MLVVIRVGADELDPERQAAMIAKAIIDVAKSIRTNSCTVSIKLWMSMMNFRKCAERLT